MTKKVFFGFWMFLALGAATVVFNSCGQSSSSDEGVVINGVKWATRNVGKSGSFVNKPEDAGMFYQWNRKQAWTGVDEELSGWDSSMPEGDAWEEANDPSPAGWRVPTLAEINKLLDTDKVSNEWTIQNGVGGRKFTDKATGNSLFLPAVGYRGGREGILDEVGALGTYWSATAYADRGAYCLNFYSSDAGSSDSFRSCGYAIRAVAVSTDL